LDTWPKIYCAIIDYYQEGFIPYYATKRGMRQLLLCFDKKDSIRLWLCNDSPEDFSGKVNLRIFHLGTERFIAEETFQVSMTQGNSGIVRDLAEFRYFFPKDSVLIALLEDESGRIVSDSIDYVTEERRLKFPEAVLEATISGNDITVSSNRFARCVEVLGEKDSDPFGWLFSDNYFDLFPDMPKKIRVVDGPNRGRITLKPYYSHSSITVEYIGV